ncbi:MAG TPA: hypothetical protein PKD00_01355 [Burkholderiales bacterium]|nr:hypothetical protein [Burkholderiales bacterium]
MAIKRLTAIEIIDETVEFYSNNDRCITEKDGCVYLNEKNQKCAHSRCLKENYLRKVIYIDYNFEHNASEIIQKFKDNCHLPKYRGQLPKFWDQIQILHDDSIYWIVDEVTNKNVLTNKGLEYVEALKKEYAIN